MAIGIGLVDKFGLVVVVVLDGDAIWVRSGRRKARCGRAHISPHTSVTSFPHEAREHAHAARGSPRTDLFCHRLAGDIAGYDDA